MAVGDPTGPALATATRSLNLGTKAEYKFTFVTPYTVNTGTTYAIVVKRPNVTNSDDAAEWFYKEGQTSRGTALYSTDGGSTWLDAPFSTVKQDYWIQFWDGVTLKDSYTFTTPDGDMNIRDAVWGAQTFDPTSTHSLSAVTIQLEDLNRYVDPQEPEDITVELYATETAGVPSKASNPSPADASGPGINFETPTLSWTGDGDTYDVYGGGGANWVLLASGISDTSYTLDANDLLQFKGLGTASWRVDSINDEGTTQGDVWTFDPRPAKVTNPSPTTASTGKSLSQLVGWDTSTYATSYDVWVNSTKTYSETTSNSSLLPLATDVLDWGTLYTWRVDSNNYYGTTEGDEWTFTTLDFDPPVTFHRLLSDQSISTDPFNPATMYFTGENFTVTMRRLLAFCGSSLWYESIDAED